MSDFIQVANTNDISPGNMIMVKVNNKEITIINSEGSYYAIDNECSHVGAPLCEGGLDGDEIICPWHRARFNIKSGVVLEYPATVDLDTYPVRVSGEHIEIKV